jgi:uncharacterized membrane protein
MIRAVTNPLYILGVLCLLVALAEWLVRKTALRHAGTALLGILLTAIAANIGIIPAGSTAEAPVPVYDAIFAWVAPLGIFWLLLAVNLRDVLRAGGPLVLLFLIGSIGTVAGAVAGMTLVNGAERIGPFYRPLGGMFASTYIGGSVNFNALALHYGVFKEGVLFAGSNAVDNVVTTLWMVATLALPRLLAPIWKPRRTAESGASGTLITGIDEDTEAIHPFDLSIMLALGFGAMLLSNWVASRPIGGVTIPSILVLTTLALLLAQFRFFAQLRGRRLLGMFAVFLFLTVIGAFCDVRKLGELGQLGAVLLVFATVTVLVHGVITFSAARVMRLDVDMAAIASQANVGGSTSALALARSLGRSDLVLPAVLIGALGNAIGTYLGFWVAESLL